jgi:hypothetical protein
MRTRTILSAAVAAGLCGLLGAGNASAERSLVGITVGRSYRTVLARYGDPNNMQPIVIQTGSAPRLGQPPGAGAGFGQPGFGAPGIPGGGPGGFPGGPSGFPGGAGPGFGGSPFGGPTPGAFPGGPGGRGFDGDSGFGPGLGSGPAGIPGLGGPPVLPGAGGGFPGAAGGGPGEPGFPGTPGFGAPGGGFGAPGGGGQQGNVRVGNAALWTYQMPNGVTYDFLINEDGLVAQITVTGRSSSARTAKGIGLGSSYSEVLSKYGFPEQQLLTPVAAAGIQQNRMSYSAMVRSGGQVNQIIYPDDHHVAFTFLNSRVVRVTVALPH